MYSISNKKSIKNKSKNINISILDGFDMASKDKVFKINGSNIREIKIINKKLANPLVSKKVFKKYDKLIEYLTDVIVDDDDSGDAVRKALDRIEKFRLEIKIKYRNFLKQKELEQMGKKLVIMQKELIKKEQIIRNSYEKIETNNRSK